jgi:ABC-type nickel/cobalt efflux system permease component RcnA
MMLGVGLTLAAVAILVIAARARLAALVAGHGGSIERLLRLLEGTTGAILLVIGARELLL